MKRRSAFTLIELLVVIAIIALLVSILMPSLQKAKEMAKDIVCRSNQRSVALAIVLYAEEHDDQYPYTSGGSGANWENLIWAHKVGRIADDPNLMPEWFNDPDPDATYAGIKDGYRICIEGYIDHNYMSRTEGAFKCPTVLSNVNQKCSGPGTWSRHFSGSSSVMPRLWDVLSESDPTEPMDCVKTTDVRKRAVLIGDCHLKPSDGIDSSVWFSTEPGTTKLRTGLGGRDVNMFGPWPFQPFAGAWSRWLPIDFYGHPGDRANLCMTDGSIESVRETDPEDWNIR